MISAWIFDLDNTLFDTRTLPGSVTDPLFQKLRAANAGPDAVTTDVLEQAFELSWTIPFPQVAETCGLPARLTDLWRDEHSRLTIHGPLEPYDDVRSVLPQLSGFRCLLTAGYPRVQHGKIDALNLRSLFDLVLVDSAEEPVRIGKQRIIQGLLEQYAWHPADVCIVGDSPTSELLAGRNLGVPTIQILRSGVSPSPIADRHIHSLNELLPD
jgi:putative hydrolase of the HAD superfamily